MRAPRLCPKNRIRLWTAAGLMLAALGMGAAQGADQDQSKAMRRRRVEKVAEVGEYPDRNWEDAFVMESPKKAYLVRTNTSREVADYIGQLMDFAQKNYRKTFANDDEIPQMEIHAYRTREEYEAVIRERAPHLAGSAGMFTVDNGVSTIHVAYVKGPIKRFPTSVLLHEGTHQFVNMTLDFRIPESARKYFPEEMRTLSSVPLWLNEGLATYMEICYYDGEELVMGEINQGRLRQLQHEILRKESIPLRELFTTDSKDFKASHYAAAWGMVYWFLNDADREKEKMKKEILREYLEACRKGFLKNPEQEFVKIFLRSNPSNFAEAWNEHIREEGFRTFLRMTIGTKASQKKWNKWEDAWHRWILKLNPNDPFGGLGK